MERAFRRRIAELIDPEIRRDIAPPVLVIKGATVVHTKPGQEEGQIFGGPGTQTIVQGDDVFVGTVLPAKETRICPPDRR